MKDDIDIANIGRNEISKRLIIGMVMALIASVAWLIMVVKDLSSLWGATLFFPFLGAMLGFLQARKKTCIALASQGKCNFDGGIRPIDDSNLAEKLKNKGNSIVYQSSLAALILTGLSIIFLRIL